jgi:hypothetical protein
MAFQTQFVVMIWSHVTAVVYFPDRPPTNQTMRMFAVILVVSLGPLPAFVEYNFSALSPVTIEHIKRLVNKCAASALENLGHGKFPSGFSSVPAPIQKWLTVEQVTPIQVIHPGFAGDIKFIELSGQAHIIPFSRNVGDSEFGIV